MIVDARTNGRQCPVGRACCTITRLNHNLIDAFESGALLQGPQTDFLKLHRGSYLAPYNFTSHCSPSSSTLPDIPVARTAPASFRRFISLGERGNHAAVPWHVPQLQSGQATDIDSAARFFIVPPFVLRMHHQDACSRGGVRPEAGQCYSQGAARFRTPFSGPLPTKSGTGRVWPNQCPFGGMFLGHADAIGCFAVRANWKFLRPPAA